MPYSPKTVIVIRVKSVARLRGSVRAVIRGIVPIVQSAQRKDGFRSSQEFVNTRYAQCSCRYGVSNVTAGLSCLGGAEM